MLVASPLGAMKLAQNGITQTPTHQVASSQSSLTGKLCEKGTSNSVGFATAIVAES